MKMIRVTSELKEGEVFLKWLYSRLIKHNKNVLGCNLGPTGSGKSYRDLRMAELWYDYHFHKPFPLDNICFGVLAALRRISSKELKRGDVIIFEESGAGLGSLDFQSKTSKMFTYVLQSFRSMNIGIFFNLPYLSMLNKQARMLMHYSFESAGVDFERKINVCKPFLQQVNQKTGKIYSKYPRIKVNGKMKTFKKFEFNLPSKYLIDAYETKKLQYLHDTTKQYTDELEKLEYDKMIKLEVKKMKESDLEWKIDLETKPIKQIAQEKGCSERRCYQKKEWFEEKGIKFKLFKKNKLNIKENELFEGSNQ
jgi:hypothetical protein